MNWLLNRWIAFAALAGALQTLTFAPLGLWWLQPFTLAILFVASVKSPTLGRAAWVGFGFGLAHFVSGISWLYISLHEYGKMAAPLAILGVFLLSCYMALYPLLAALFTRWLGMRDRMPTAWAPLVFASAWFLSEMGRGWVFTGFPWLASGYAHTNGLLGGWATLFGVYGTGFIVALIAAYSAREIIFSGLTRARIVQNLLLLLFPVFVIGFIAQEFPKTTVAAARPASLTVRLLQGNVPQSMKFESISIINAARDYTQMAAKPSADHPVDVIVLPETAIPVAAERFPQAIENLGTVARQQNSSILLGLPDNMNGRWTNSVLLINPQGRVESQRYSKQHLVPFGEFIPFGFRWFVDAMQMPLGDFARGASDQPPFIIKGVRIAPNICYEDVFGGELRDDAQQADILLNLSNLAWFGDSWAMPQHLQIAQMRSLELGRPSLRATNTGVTAVIDAYGKVEHQLALNTSASLDAKVRIATRDTLYLQMGDLPLLLFAMMVLLQCWRTRQKQTLRAASSSDVMDVEFREIS